MVVFETGDRLVDAEISPRGERDEPDVQGEAGLLNFTNKLRELRVSARAVEDLEKKQWVWLLRVKEKDSFQMSQIFNYSTGRSFTTITLNWKD